MLRGAEHDAFFHLFSILAGADEAQLEQASDGDKSFVQLFEQSRQYRGRLVTLRGAVRAAYKVTAGRNDYGVEHFYHIWFQPADAPESFEFVYALEIPPEFPIGDKLSEQVEVTGFHFKRLAYKAKHDIRTAPLLLTKTLRWEKPTAAEAPREPTVAGFLWILGGAGLFAVLAIALVFSRSYGRHVLPDYVKRNMRQDESVGDLRNLDAGPNVQEKLAQLESAADGNEEPPDGDQ